MAKKKNTEVDNFIEMVTEIEDQRFSMLSDIASLMDSNAIKSLKAYYTDKGLRRFLTEDEIDAIRRFVERNLEAIDLRH